MYSSTNLKGPAESGCWKMLDYAESNTPSLFPLEYRSYLGQAAHAVLQYCAERKVTTEAEYRKTAEEVGSLLIREGRTFRGRQEPPLPADDVWAGVDVALAYLDARGLPVDAEQMWPERDWEHPTIPARALIDLVTVHEEGDEEYGQRVLTVTDYKTSWQADGDELNSLQRWMQTVIMWRDRMHNRHRPHRFEDADIIRQSVINLRTWQEYTRDIRLDDPDDIAEMEKWEQRITKLCETADLMRGINTPEKLSDERPASPGVGCLSCAWRHVCKEVWDVADDTDKSKAIALSILEGHRTLAIAALKKADPESPITIPGGFVGYQEQVRRVAKQGIGAKLLRDWLNATACDIADTDMPMLESFANALGLSKSNLDAYAKAVMPERRKGVKEDRAAMVEEWTDERRYGQFGVWKDEQRSD